MKNHYLLLWLALALLSFAGCGSDNDAVEEMKPEGKNGHFCVEGKTWTLSLTAVVRYPYIYQYKETTLKGDTVVGGMTFMKMYTRTYKPDEPAPETWTDTHCWLGEDGDKVYKYSETKDESSLLFDFSAEEGGGVHWVLADVDVKRVVSIPCTDEKDRKALFLYLGTKPDTEYMYIDTWVKEVGSIMYGVSDSDIDAHTLGTERKLEKCAVGSTVIFDRAAMEQHILPDDYLL